MRVGVNGTFSARTYILSGVPQGSVIGLFLFILFVDDLPDWMVNSMRKFADDINVWYSIRSLPDSQSLQDDNLNKWADQWLLRFKAAKCKVVPVGYKFPTV